MTDEPIRIGRWTQIGPRHKKTLFRCDCGTEKIIDTHNVLSGKSRSCGCFHRERRPAISRAANTKHGWFGTTEYVIWAGMIARCHGSFRRGSYANYGARGIRVCKRWRFGSDDKTGFECFLADMGQRPQGRSIDRIDPSGDYEPGNCRWATSKVQSRNKRTSRMVVLDGVRMCVADAAELHGVDCGLVRCRLKRGWSIKRAVSTPAISPKSA